MKKEVFLPINTEKENIQNKRCDYKTLGIMTLYSNMKPIEKQDEEGVYETNRYIYKNKIMLNKDEIEELSGVKIKTVCDNMRKLSKLEGNLVVPCISKDEQIYYIVNYESKDGNKFTTIHEKMLRKLINSTNSNVIKVYLIIKYMCEYELKKNGNKEKKITNAYLAEQIGLSSKSHKNINLITDITDTLHQLGFINKHYVNTSKGIKTNIYYSINNYEEWESKQPSRIRRRRMN